MSTKWIIAAAALGAVLLAGCVETQTRPVSVRNSELTHGNVQMNLKVGQTTQTQVLETFGAPNITSIDASNQEVWTYQRQATVSQSSSSSNYWTIVLAGGASNASGFEQTQRTMTLIIKFDANKVVSDFRSRSSEF
jgi:outer membrane protein assembly factor BamE (lipoprotein component of BamABCDE complex)